ncbi:hypothetical protein HispidOSU_003571, partial [Sigmodon hispidus]
MKRLLLTVTLSALVTVLQTQDDLPFLSEDKNVSGTWYIKAIVSEGLQNITEWKIPTVEYPFVVRSLEKGNMQITTVHMIESECINTDFVMEKTEKPGQYKALWDTFLMYIYELPVKDHYILYTDFQYFDQKIHMGELIGKDPQENLEALEEFKKFSQMKGFSAKDIFVPEQR